MPSAKEHAGVRVPRLVDFTLSLSSARFVDTSRDNQRNSVFDRPIQTHAEDVGPLPQNNHPRPAQYDGSSAVRHFPKRRLIFGAELLPGLDFLRGELARPGRCGDVDKSHGHSLPATRDVLVQALGHIRRKSELMRGGSRDSSIEKRKVQPLGEHATHLVAVCAV